MSTVAIASPASVALPGLPAASPARSPIGHWWVHVTYWPAELLRLVALIYMLPIVIYAIGIPIGLAFYALFVVLEGSWKGFWQ